MMMKLSDGERLIALMLADVLKAVRWKDGIDPDFVTSAINSGNLWALKTRYPGLTDHDADDEVVSEVREILSVTSIIEKAIGRLPEEELFYIAPAHRQIFSGFDGNNESEHYSVAHFIIHDMNEFEYFANRQLNSHGPSLDHYRALIARYNDIGGRAALLDRQKISRLLLI
jgi:uncharacterized protein YfbU (UPF0304 family)